MKYFLFLLIVLFSIITNKTHGQSILDSLKSHESNYSECMSIIESQFNFLNSRFFNVQVGDSLNYTIKREYFGDTIVKETTQNYITSIAREITYSNNKIIVIGFKTHLNESYIIDIGFWKYFSKEGVLDSIVDKEKHLKVKFCDFFKMAQKAGVVGENSILVLERGIEDRTSLTQGWNSLSIYPYTFEQELGMYRSYIYYSPNNWGAQKCICYNGLKSYVSFVFEYNVESNRIYRYQMGPNFNSR